MTASGRLLARNAALNLAGQGIPFLIGLAALPATVHALGADRFGLLGLAWVILGYFSMLDLGMGRATTRFAAHAIGRGAPHEVSTLTWSAALVQAVLGLGGALALATFAAPLVTGVLHVTGTLSAEAVATFRALAVAVPVVLISASFRGVLEAAQRFDLVYAVTLPGSALNFLIPLLGALAGSGLPEIIWLLVGARGLALAAYFLLGARLFPGLLRVTPRLATVRRLLPFGAWTTVSNVVSPVLDQLDRVLLGSFAGIASVGYYTAPQEMVLRTRILPTAIATTLFPEFSASEQSGARTQQYYGVAVRVLGLLLAPVTLTLVILGPDLLRVWLGGSFAARGGAALQWLGIGILANSVAYVPFAYLHGINRPDLPGKFHLLELPLFLALAWLLMPRWGAAGAGAAWAARAILDSGLLLKAAAHTGATGGKPVLAPRALAWLALVGLGVAAALGGVYAGRAPWVRVAAAVVWCGAAIWGGWIALLEPEDRARLRRGSAPRQVPS